MASDVSFTVTGRDAGAKAALASASQQATGLGRSVQRVGEIAQGIIAAQLFQQIGQAADRFLGQARDASSDLGESVNAVNVTFKGAAGGIHELGETAATSMGLSQNAFNAAAVRFSAFASSVAGPGGDVTKTIQDITQRSSDFASVMNLDVNEAMQVFQSGLAGESEPLRRYGIDVSAAAVQTFAYANGIAEAGSELTEAQKIQGRYGLIMQQTAEMAGDFANTSDSLANSQRILAAEMENAQAVVGQLMVPGLEALNAVLIPLVQAFTDAPKPIQLIIGSLVLLGAGIVSVTTRLAPMIIAMQAAGISMRSVATQARAAALSVTSLSLAVATAGAGIIAWGQSARHTQGNVQGLSTDIERLADTGKAIGQLKAMFGEGAAGAEEFKDKLDVATAGFFNWSDSLNRSFDETSKAKSAFEDLDQALASMVAEGADADELMRLLTETYGLNEEQVNKLKDALPEYTMAAERAEGQTDDMAGAQEGAADAAESHLDSLEALADHMKAQLDPVFGFTKAQQELRDAQKAVTDAEKDHGRKSPEYQQALRDEAEAALGVLVAAGQLGDEFTGDLSDAQRQMLQDAGLSDDAIRRLEKDLRDAKREADRLDGTRVRITTTELRITQHKNVFLAPSGSRHQAKAHGGIVGAQGGGPRSRMTLVGEQGPELVDLAPGSFVHPAGETRDRLSAAAPGDQPPHVDVRVFIGEHELDAMVKASVRRGKRTDPSFRTVLAGR